MKKTILFPLISLSLFAQQVDWNTGIRNRPATASANTPGALVIRDASGNFSAGTITADAFIGPSPSSLLSGDIVDLTSNNKFANSSQYYNFTSQTPGGTLTASVPATITLTPCPLGVNGADVSHYLYVSGGTGTAESVLITGGTCTSGLTTGTLTFTPGQNHSGSWTIQSATFGVQEALVALGAGKTVLILPGSYTQYASININNDNQGILGVNSKSVYITLANGSNVNSMINVEKKGVRIAGITLDGNYRNQSSGNGHGINVYNTTEVEIHDCIIRAFGTGTYASGIFYITANNISIHNNKFESNYNSDIGAYMSDTPPTKNIAVNHNQFGNPLVTDSNSNTNWWDTRAAGLTAITLIGEGSQAIGNRVYGGARITGTSARYNPLVAWRCNKCVISDNLINGLGNAYGTINVNQGSGAITGTNTFFSTILTVGDPYSDINSYFMIEGDTTLYKVSAVASGTSLTVTPVVVRASGTNLRYQMNYVGDMYTLSAIKNTTFTGNFGIYGHDTGIQIGADASSYAVNNTITGNTMSFMWNGGFSCFSGCSGLVVSGNNFSDNGKGGTQTIAGYRVGIILSDAWPGVLQDVNNVYIGGNLMTTTYGEVGQQYGIYIDDQNSKISYLTFGTNHVSLMGVQGTYPNDLSPYYVYAYLGSMNINSPMKIAGLTAQPGVEVGALEILAQDDYNMSLACYISGAYCWVQSSLTGISQSPLYLNPAGGNVRIGLGGLKMDHGTEPTCAVGERGVVKMVQGGAGVADTLRICRKDASNNYAWVALY